jgi:hypothetical protein
MIEKKEIEDLVYKYSEYDSSGETILKQVMFYALVDDLWEFVISSHKEGYSKGMEDANNLPF